MSIKFEFYESPDPTGENENKYHARVVTWKTVTSEQIAEEIQMASSLTVSDVDAVLSALSNRISFHLAQSNRVHLQGIGYFQTTLKTSREIDPEKTRAQSVWFKSVKFRADQKLKNSLAMVRTERAEQKVHSPKLTNEEVDRKVTKYLQKNHFIIRADLQCLLGGMTKSTTQRHISRMLEEEKIRKTGSRSNPIYVLR